MTCKENVSFIGKTICTDNKDQVFVTDIFWRNWDLYTTVFLDEIGTKYGIMNLQETFILLIHLPSSTHLMSAEGSSSLFIKARPWRIGFKYDSKPPDNPVLFA